MDKKDQIIEVALKLFAKNGFEKTPVTAICEEAEVSKGLVFHHFKNKNELLREVFKYITQIIDETDDSFLAVEDPKQRLKTLIEAIFAGMSVPEHRAIYQFNFNVMVQPITRALLIDLIDERMDALREGAEEVFEYLGHAQPAVISRMFVAEIDGIALNYLLNDDFPLEAVKQEFIKKYC